LKKRVKKTYAIHHWLGLLAGIFLLISSVTGSVLVFHHDIDHAQFAKHATLSSPASGLKIDNSFERIRQQYADSDIRVPEIPDSPTQALKYEIRQGNVRKWLFVHPTSGEKLATVDRADKRLVHVLLDLHYNLLSGTPGKIIVLLGGLSLITLTITGLLLYRRSLVKVLSFRQRISFKSRYTFFSSLHRVVGVWSLVFNLLLSITGTWIAYTIVDAALKPAVQPVTIQPAAVSVDAVLEKVKAEQPQFDINYLRFAGNTLSVLGRLHNDPAYYGFTYSNMQVNLGTGEITSINFVRDLPWYKRALTVLKPLHFGDYAGLGIKLLYSFFGILPGLLSISGFLIWKLRPKGNQPKISSPKVKRHYTTADKTIA